MNNLRAVMIASIAVLATACASTPSTPIPPAAPVIASIGGNWTLVVDTPNGPMNFTMSVVQSGTSVNAKITDTRGTYDYNGTIDGNAVKIGHDSINMPGMRIEYIGTVVADTFSGKAVFGNFGEGTFTAKRQ